MLVIRNTRAIQNNLLLYFHGSVASTNPHTIKLSEDINSTSDTEPLLVNTVISKEKLEVVLNEANRLEVKLELCLISSNLNK